MVRKVIIQIGRLDKNYRNKIDFLYEGKSGKAELSGQFVLNSGVMEKGELLIIFPKSIILQDYLINNEELKENDGFVENISKISIEKYLENPSDLLKSHPHLTNTTKFTVVDSIGSYLFKGETVSFSSSLKQITLQIYTYLVSNYSSDEFEEIYIDISSGHNIYISGLINAMELLRNKLGH